MTLPISERDDLEFYANDLGLEVDADMTDEDLQALCIKTLDTVNDDEWDALDETRTQAWSNTINEERIAAKKAAAAKDKKTKAAPKKTSVKKDAGKEPSKAELTAAKAKAKKKAAEGGAKKQVVSKEPYRYGSTAWHVWDIIHGAGKGGISIKDALPLFEARVKKHKLVTSNAKSRVNTIVRQCVFKELATKKNDKFFNTPKSTAAMKTAMAAEKAKANKKDK